jgi:hypothetical protein
MSRAVFAVVMCGSSDAVSEVAHCRAIAWANWASLRTSAAVSGYQKLRRAICSGVTSQVTGAL